MTTPKNRVAARTPTRGIPSINRRITTSRNKGYRRPAHGEECQYRKGRCAAQVGDSPCYLLAHGSEMCSNGLVEGNPIAIAISERGVAETAEIVEPSGRNEMRRPALAAGSQPPAGRPAHLARVNRR